MSAFWTRGRDIGAENENAAAAGPRARSWRLTSVDRCDRCGAQAYVRVLLPGRLELLFCAHHNRQYSSALADIAVEIQDETMRLAYCALFGIRVIPISQLTEEPTQHAGGDHSADASASLALVVRGHLVAAAAPGPFAR